MNRLLPGRIEIAIFATLAIGFAVVVSLSQAANRDLLTAGMCVPLFIVAAVLGLRRSPQWQPVSEPIASTEPSVTSADDQ